jgi:aryl-alcohol dehydrogenase-like predicted oxidoreductase
VKSRELGQGLSVSSLGLGCASMSGLYGEFDDAESVSTIVRAVELGVTLFDTADSYGPFANEALVGRALAPFGDDVVIATKFGFVRDSADRHHGVNGRPEYVRRSCELSLQRLGTDCIDVYLQHRVDPDTPIEETVGAMAELVQAGKVKRLGLSEASAETIRRAHAVHPIAVLQSEYSLFTRELEHEVLPTCRELGIGLIAYSPLGRGFLGGNIASLEELPATDWRRRSPRFQGDALQRNLELVETVRQIADDLDTTPAQLAIAWVMAQGDDIVPIPGTRRRKYLELNAAAADLVLSPEHLERLENAVPVDAAAGDRYPDMSIIDR